MTFSIRTHTYTHHVYSESMCAEMKQQKEDDDDDVRESD